MSPRPHRSLRSSTGSAPVELPLPSAPWLASLLTLHALGIPLLLILLPLRHGALAAAGCLGLAVLAAPAGARLCLGWGPDAPRALCFTAEGVFRLVLAGGATHAVVPAARSLIAGPWWLLVLEGVRQRHYVLLETFRVDPHPRAALGRVLRRVATGHGGPRRALRSLIEPGRPGD